MKKYELFPMNLQYFAEGEGEGETAPEVAAPVEEAATSEEPTGEAAEESTEPQFDTDKQNAAFAQMRRRMEAAERKAAEIDAMYAKQFEGYTNPETGAPIKSARDYADALAAQQRLQAREKLQQANVDPNLIDNLIANSPVLRQAEEAMALMAPAMAEIYRREAAAGRAPVLSETCERAVLAQLRSMTEAEFAALDEGGEGLANRFRAAAQTAATLTELLDAVKTKRYAYARLRRMALWAYLGITPAQRPERVPYLRVLAANERGRALLGQMKKTAVLPVITKPAQARRLTEDAAEIFALEARATDLYTLAYPDLRASAAGAEWTESPVIL